MATVVVLSGMAYVSRYARIRNPIQHFMFRNSAFASRIILLVQMEERDYKQATGACQDKSREQKKLTSRKRKRRTTNLSKTGERGVLTPQWKQQPGVNTPRSPVFDTLVSFRLVSFTSQFR